MLGNHAGGCRKDGIRIGALGGLLPEKIQEAETCLIGA